MPSRRQFIKRSNGRKVRESKLRHSPIGVLRSYHVTGHIGVEEGLRLRVARRFGRKALVLARADRNQVGDLVLAKLLRLVLRGSEAMLDLLMRLLLQAVFYVACEMIRIAVFAHL